MPLNALATWHRILQHRDLRALDTLLSDDVVLHSPVVHTPQAGRALVKMYLEAAFHVFLNESFHYVRELTGERDAVLEFQVQIDGLFVNGVDMLKWNEAGQLIDFKVMVRPLKAVNLIHQKMGLLLEQHLKRTST